MQSIYMLYIILAHIHFLNGLQFATTATTHVVAEAIDLCVNILATFSSCHPLQHHESRGHGISKH